MKLLVAIMIGSPEDGSYLYTRACIIITAEELIENGMAAPLHSVEIPLL
jgi:hypothetical protein